MTYLTHNFESQLFHEMKLVIVKLDCRQNITTLSLLSRGLELLQPGQRSTHVYIRTGGPGLGIFFILREVIKRYDLFMMLLTLCGILAVILGSDKEKKD